jgi:hypothetical protein
MMQYLQAIHLQDKQEAKKLEAELKNKYNPAYRIYWLISSFVLLSKKGSSKAKR